MRFLSILLLAILPTIAFADAGLPWGGSVDSMAPDFAGVQVVVDNVPTTTELALRLTVVKADGTTGTQKIGPIVAGTNTIGRVYRLPTVADPLRIRVEIIQRKTGQPATAKIVLLGDVTTLDPLALLDSYLLDALRAVYAGSPPAEVAAVATRLRQAAIVAHNARINAEILQRTAQQKTYE